MVIIETLKAIHLAILAAAFNAVQAPGNWKNPIRAEVPRRMAPVVVEAIGFYAGGGARAELILGDMVRVTAPGYYLMVGA